MKANPDQPVITQAEPLPAPMPEPAPAEQPPLPRYVYTPPLDIHDTTEGLVLEADLPGVAPENLQIQVENNVLHIFGKVAWPLPTDARLLHEELRPADFYRSFILSDEVDAEKIVADFNDGVLRLTLPKAAKAKPRKIEVRTGTGNA